MHFLTRRRLTAVAAAVGTLGGALALAARPVASAAPPPVSTLAFIAGAGRLVELNAAESARLVRSGRQLVDVSGSSGLADGKATMVVLDVTVVRPTRSGRVTLAPAVNGKGVSALAVTVPFGKGPNRTTRVAVPIGVKSSLSYGTTAGLNGLYVDVVGWAGPTSRLAPDDEPVLLPPCRVVDTATGDGGIQGRITPDRGLAFEVLGIAQIPAKPVKSVVYAVVASDITKKSVLRVTGGPASISLNLAAKAKPQLFYVSLPGTAGMEMTLTLTGGEVHVGVDAFAFDDGSGDMSPAGPCEFDDPESLAVAAPVTNLGATPTGTVPVTSAPTTTAQPTTTAPRPSTTTTVFQPVITQIVNPGITSVTTTTQPGATTSTTAPPGATTTTTTPTTTTAPQDPNRATSDRPDSIQGPQLHVVYMTASDGTDRSYDANGTIAGSVSAWQNFLSGQIGRRLKVDEFGGLPDITFVKSTFNEQSLAGFGSDQLRWIREGLKASGLDDPNKYYLVYYDGTSNFACGSAPHPPNLGGRVAAVYLKATPSAGSCPSVGLQNGTPGYWEYLALHEVLHMMGLPSAGCAPGVSAEGHVSNPNDLMYGGPSAWTPSVVDPTHAAYYKVTTAGCLDLDKSALLEAAGAGAWLPPSGPEGGGGGGDHEE